MKWEQFLNDVKDQPVIESRYLHLLYPNPRAVDLQISRWFKQKKIHRLTPYNAPQQVIGVLSQVRSVF